MTDTWTKLDFYQVLEAMTESILITDASLDKPGPYILYVNSALERMTGWTRDEVIGQSPRMLQGPITHGLRCYEDDPYGLICPE